MVDDPPGSFAVFIGHIEGGRPYPFEVWVNGAEQPRGLGRYRDVPNENPDAWANRALGSSPQGSGATVRRVKALRPWCGPRAIR